MKASRFSARSVAARMLVSFGVLFAPYANASDRPTRVSPDPGLELIEKVHAKGQQFWTCDGTWKNTQAKATFDGGEHFFELFEGNLRPNWRFNRSPGQITAKADFVADALPGTISEVKLVVLRNTITDEDLKRVKQVLRTDLIGGTGPATGIVLGGIVQAAEECTGEKKGQVRFSEYEGNYGMYGLKAGAAPDNGAPTDEQKRTQIDRAAIVRQIAAMDRRCALA